MASPDAKPFMEVNGSCQGEKKSSKLLHRFLYQSQDHLKYKLAHLLEHLHLFPLLDKMNKLGSLTVVLLNPNSLCPYLEAVFPSFKKTSTKPRAQDEKAEIKELCNSELV